VREESRTVSSVSTGVKPEGFFL